MLYDRRRHWQLYTDPSANRGLLLHCTPRLLDVSLDSSRRQRTRNKNHIPTEIQCRFYGVAFHPIIGHHGCVIFISNNALNTMRPSDRPVPSKIKKSCRKLKINEKVAWATSKWWNIDKRSKVTRRRKV